MQNWNAKRYVDARVMDGQALAFEGEFDAVFSNAALHWMREPDRVLAGVHRALRPGGRFVAEFGGHGNVAAITVALLAVLGQHGVSAENAIPWYFPTAEAYRQRLETHGFKVPDIALTPRPTPLPTDVGGWLDTFAGPFFARLPEGERTRARDEAAALLHPVLCDDHGRWFADYVRLRFLAMRGD
jgi:SAM-dependent methyltransferase